MMSDTTSLAKRSRSAPQALGTRAAPGIEPGTSRTRSKNHATRPSSLILDLISNGSIRPPCICALAYSAGKWRACALCSTWRREQALSPEQTGALPLCLCRHVCRTLGTCWGAALDFNPAMAGKQSMPHVPGYDLEQSPATPTGADKCVHSYMSSLWSAAGSHVFVWQAVLVNCATWPNSDCHRMGCSGN